MKRSSIGTILVLALAASLCSIAHAQAPISENFTGTTTTNSWYFSNGACLTAGTSTSTTSPGTVPACTSLLQSYYSQQEDHDAALVGGVDGYLGSSSAPASTSAAVPDPSGQGALRFTNGYPYGNGENGAIMSASTFPTGEGIRIQFMTVTYHGDSGGNGAGCPSGSTASNGQCVSTTSIGATATYSCPSGYTLSGTNCTETQAATRSGHPGDYTYSCPSGYTLSGTTCTKSVAATGTYSCSSGYTLSGSNCTETTVVLASDPHQNDGADGISFFLMDGSQSVTFEGGTVSNSGSWGGSLGYSCSNSNPPYNGLVGAYVGLGIDEYGNFLNGTQNTLGVTDPQSLGDNTASGGGQWANRIGLRGSGNVSWYWLNANYPTYYPSTLTTAQQQSAVQSTCETGTLWNYSSPSAPTNTGATSASSGPVLYDYQAIPNAYSVLSGVQIANESATTRAQAVPITYDLQITQDGLLSLSYSVNGGATQQVIQNQSITASNGPLPSSFRFGFAGSTGGSTNIHEILCFQAQPNSVSQSSAGVNQKLSAQIQTGAYAYFAYFDPDDWAGRMTADQLGTDSSGNLVIYTTPTWDASCVLTGGNCASTGATNIIAESPSSRVILTWNGTTGIPFEWSSLTAAQQSALDSTDSTETANRLNYLRGDTSNDVGTDATCTAASSGLPCFRDRTGILGDIIDSSPTWVGAPSAPYAATFSDRLYPSATAAENASGAQTYPSFISAEETRENVVYVGANDGLLHGFRSGANTSTGTFDTTAPNDGEEVLAYMPGSVISGAVLTTGTGTSTSVVDTIHGTNPTSSPTSNAVTTNLDFSNTQYGHNYTVDATPGSGDLFYQGAWHSWLVGGLGPGGAAIYALDVTNPSGFSEADASSIVIGEWTAATITCSNVSNCGQDLGDTYGTPAIRRTHAQNGSGENEWAVMWGNGFGSSSGDAGIFVMTIDPATGSETTYYLSTGTAGTNNGIAYVTPADLDGDHTTDYVYAGDLKGNIWRFDLTSTNPGAWSITRCLDAGCTTTTSAPLFTASSGQPITSQLALAVGQTAAGAQTLVITFGTGQKSPFTNTGAATYQSGTQSIYGVWDWAMANWNARGSTQYAALQPGTALDTITPANLEAQAVTVNSTNGDRDITANATVCWQGTAACGSGSNDQYGWYLNLPGSAAQGPEQIVYNPLLVGDVMVINSTIPPNSTQLSCNPLTETGYTYAVEALTGGALPNIFPQYYDTSAVGVNTNATGTVWEVTTSNNNHYLVYQTTSSGSGSTGTTGGGSTGTNSYQECGPGSNCLQYNPPGNSGHRLTWIELR